MILYIFTRSKTFQVPLSDEIEHYSLGNESIERSFTDERFWLYVFSSNDLAGSILPSPLQSRGIGSAMQCPKETSFVCFHPTSQEAILKRVVWPPWKEIQQLHVPADAEGPLMRCMDSEATMPASHLSPSNDFHDSVTVSMSQPQSHLPFQSNTDHW